MSNNVIVLNIHGDNLCDNVLNIHGNNLYEKKKRNTNLSNDMQKCYNKEIL